MIMKMNSGEDRMKRYTDTTISAPYEEDECISDMVEDTEGDYVKYEDVQELIEWMRKKVKEWKNNGSDSIGSPYWGPQHWAYLEGCEYCSEEIEQKLREIGGL